MTTQTSRPPRQRPTWRRLLVVTSATAGTLAVIGVILCLIAVLVVQHYVGGFAPSIATVAPLPPESTTDVCRDGIPRWHGLCVGEFASKTGYDRAEFGPPWADVDHNRCDTRDDILARDLTQITRAADGCRVLTGELRSPYTGQVIAFQYGIRSQPVQIDHLVPLAFAWQTGALTWTPAQREAFANDPANLRAVDAHSNESKGDSDGPTYWIPPLPSEGCPYVRAQIAVTTKYRLWITPTERDAWVAVLSGCRR